MTYNRRCSDRRQEFVVEIILTSSSHTPPGRGDVHANLFWSPSLSPQMLFYYLALFGIVLLAQCDACSVPLFSIIVVATKILGYFGGPFESFAALVLLYANLCVFTLFPPKELPAEGANSYSANSRHSYKRCPLFSSFSTSEATSVHGSATQSSRSRHAFLQVVRPPLALAANRPRRRLLRPLHAA